MSIAAASSIADRRVTRTPHLANSTAPSAVANVKVAGSATGSMNATPELMNAGSATIHVLGWRRCTLPKAIVELRITSETRWLAEPPKV